MEVRSRPPDRIRFPISKRTWPSRILRSPQNAKGAVRAKPARLCYDQSRKDDARSHLDKAAEIVAGTGYHRRDAEVEDLRRKLGVEAQPPPGAPADESDVGHG